MSDHAEHGHGGGHEEAAHDKHDAAHAKPAEAGHGAEHGHDAHGAHDNHAKKEAHSDAHAGHAKPDDHGKKEAHGDAHAGHAKAPAAKGHAEAHATTKGGKNPIIAFRDWIFDTSSSVVNTTTEIGDSINKYLCTDDLATGSEKRSLLETPFYAAGHVVEGTVGNAARRSMEIISPICSFVRSAISTTIGTILKPSNFKNGETRENAIGMVKSAGMLGKNLLMAIPRAANELADFAIDRTIQQVSSQIERIPVVGKFISGPLKWISNKVKNAVSTVTDIADKLTSPLGGKSTRTAPAHAATDHGHAGHAEAAHAH